MMSTIERRMYDQFRRLSGCVTTDLALMRDYAQLRRLAFPTQTRKAYRDWVKRNPTGPREAARRWRQTHSEEAKARKWWYEHFSPRSIAGHRRRKVIREARRRARKRAATIGETSAIMAIYARCQELRKWFDVVVDHKIPLAKGGAHSAENLQIIYSTENVRKGVSLTYKPKVVFV
jgi:5-methylcytosine-specific restriction endonuclease McrA